MHLGSQRGKVNFAKLFLSELKDKKKNLAKLKQLSAEQEMSPFYATEKFYNNCVKGIFNIRTTTFLPQEKKKVRRHPSTFLNLRYSQQ